MSNQTRYNQILFLTTLSVYMGLVLMGGASPALAHAALAKSFELKTELEARDDLDKKPGDEEEKPESVALKQYFRVNEWFLEDIQELSRDRKFNVGTDTFSLTQLSTFPCDESKTAAYVRGIEESRNVRNKLLEEAVNVMVSRLEGFEKLADCLPYELFEWKHTADVGIDLNYDGSFLKTSTNVKKETIQKAALFSEELRLAFHAFEPDEDDPREKLLYENTRISSDNDQVFIVTNLPRAGLDELLALK
jgi:hypothetical protein